jgi:hypothetical protein
LSHGSHAFLEIFGSKLFTLNFQFTLIRDPHSFGQTKTQSIA